MAIRHREVFPDGSSPDSIDWRVWNDDHVGIAGSITQDQQDALDAANAPTTGNPFATLADVGIQTARVQLTDAQIKTLATSPVTLLANPGAGFVLMPTLVHVVLDTSAGAYVAGSGGSEVGLAWEGEDGNSANVPILVPDNVVEAAGIYVATFIPSVDLEPAPPPIIAILNILGSTVFNVFAEKGLILGNWADPLDLPNSNWTAGNAANTLSVYVEYRVLPITPFA